MKILFTKRIMICCLTTLILSVTYSIDAFAQCDDGRYYDRIFSPSHSGFSLPSEITYGQSEDYEGNMNDLKMRVYQPVDDPIPHRPLIILAHGGSFLEGVKESPDVLRICEEFARRGYVTATISYRLGVPAVDSVNMLKAVVRGVQDARAAVRFFFKDAQTDNAFRIDTNQIFMGGVSAGAFIGLHLGYMTDTATLEPYMKDLVNDVGGFEGNSGNPGYSSDIKGVINLFGAIGDTVWIQPDGPSLVSMHGTEDGTVPFESDVIRVSGQNLMVVHGSGSINNRMQNIGKEHDFHPFIGADHVPYPLFLIPGTADAAYMDSVINFVRDFLVKNTDCPDITSIELVSENIESELFVYPNPAQETINILVNKLESGVLSIFDMQGRTVYTEKLNGQMHQINTTMFNSGVYLLKVKSDHSNQYHTQKIQIVQ